MDAEELIITTVRDVGARMDTGFTNVRQDISEVHTRVDDVIKRFSDHEVSDTGHFGELRSDIRELQTTRTTLRWFIGIVIVAFVGGVVEHLMNHTGPTATAAVHAVEKADHISH